MDKELLEDASIVTDIKTGKKRIVNTKRVKGGSAFHKGAVKKNNYYEPVFRGCAFPDTPNLAKGRHSVHPLALWSFGKNKKKRTTS